MAINTTLTDSEGFVWDLRPTSVILPPRLGVQGGTNDAFDDAFALSVNGVGIDPQNTFSAQTNEIDTQPVLADGIAVTRSIFVSDALSGLPGFARFLDSFTNGSGETRTITVTIDSNSGNDGQTSVRATAGGDILGINILAADDIGFVLDEGNNPTGGDPAVMHAYGDAAAGSLRPSTAALGDFIASGLVDQTRLTFALTLAPGETRSLLHFASQSTTAAEAVSDLETFTSSGATLRQGGLLAGLSNTELRTVANYSGLDATGSVRLNDGSGVRWTVDGTIGALSTRDTAALASFQLQSLTDSRSGAQSLTLSDDGREATFSSGFGGVGSYRYRYRASEEGFIRLLVEIDGISATINAPNNGEPRLNYGASPSLQAAVIAGQGLVIDDSATGLGGILPALTVATGEIGTPTTSNNITTWGGSALPIPIGQTRSLLFFFAASDSGAQALARLNRLGQPDAEALAGLSAADIGRIVNVAIDPDARFARTTLAADETEAQGSDLPDLITGNAEDNVLVGDGGDDRLFGLGGDDMLIGGAGPDAMTGGAGNDTYVVENAGDTVQESATRTGGSDTVRASIAHTLAAAVETLALTGTRSIAGTGNEMANTLIGNGSGNVLNGLAGADRMFGGNGDDTYVVDVASDETIETSAAGGRDTVLSAVSRTLGDNLENMTLTGTRSVSAIGNALANVLTGNAGNNTLIGAGGADTMNGGAGADTFRFLAAADSAGALRDAILGFDGAGAAAGDRIDLAAIDADTTRAGDQAFVFGTATGVGRLFAVNEGRSTVILGNTDADAAPEFALVIADGSRIAAATYVAGDFVL